MQVLYESKPSKSEQEIKPYSPLMKILGQEPIVESKIPQTIQKGVVQPIKYIQHLPIFKKRRYKVLKFLDLKASPTIKYHKVKRVFQSVKYIAKARFDYQPQKNFEFLYNIFSKKVQALEANRLTNLPFPQKEMVIRRLREFRYINSLSMVDIKAEGEKYKMKELKNFQYSIQSLRNLESVSFKGERNLSFLNEAVCKIFPFLNKIKKMEGPIEGLVRKDLVRGRHSLAKLQKIQEYKLEISEHALQMLACQIPAFYYLKYWISNLEYTTKLVLVVTGAEFNVDLSPLNDIQGLEIIYELSESLPVLANNVQNIENLLLPVSFEWKVNPSDTHNHAVTEGLMQSLCQLNNVKKMSQLYSFQDELSILKGCYPIWRDIMSDYNFRTIENLNLGIFLNESSVEKFQTIFIETLRGMHRLRSLSLTLHNDGSSSKRFHLTGTILELPKVLGMLPCLSEFEFNTEIEILLNILNEFFRALTQLKSLKKFRSEWLQISQNSFKNFAKRLHQMRNLELMDIHLYSLFDIPRKEFASIFASLGESLEKMPNLKVIQITADNECFAQDNIWQQWQDQLRARCEKKFIELTLAETE